MTTIYAPFTKEQGESITEYQKSKYVHPFSCPLCGKPLEIVNEMLICPERHQSQKWCHQIMGDWSWKKLLEPSLENMILHNVMRSSSIPDNEFLKIKEQLTELKGKRSKK